MNDEQIREEYLRRFPDHRAGLESWEQNAPPVLVKTRLRLAILTGIPIRTDGAVEAALYIRGR